MKLASLKQGGRDGALVVVDSTLTRYLRADAVAPTLQTAIENWRSAAPGLGRLAARVETAANSETEVFDPAACASPLPRSYQFVDGSAYLVHVELLRKARGATLPESFKTDPLMYEGLSDGFLGPREDIAVAAEDWGIDLEAEIAVIVDDVPMGISPEAAAAHIKLVMLLNDVSLRNLIPAELAKGFGFLHGKPASAFSPVAVTPEALGEDWDGGKLSLPLMSQVNGKPIGQPDAGRDLAFDFPKLIAHAAKTRSLCAGTIIGSGTVANRDRATGSSCLAELRMIEKLDSGEIKTPFLRFGDSLRIEMLDRQGRSIFGAIEQKVVRGATPGT